VWPEYRALSQSKRKTQGASSLAETLDQQTEEENQWQKPGDRGEELTASQYLSFPVRNMRPSPSPSLPALSLQGPLYSLLN